MHDFRWAWSAALALVLTIGSAAPAAAQRPLRDVGSDLKHVGEDVWHVWTSPVRGTPGDWLGAAGVGAVFFALIPVDDNLDAWATRNADHGFFKSLKEVRHGGALFTGKTIVPVAAAAYVAGIAFDKQGLRDGLMGCVASYASNSFPRKAMYRVIGRERPEVADGDQHRWNFPGEAGGKDSVTRSARTGWYDNSFPGGHVANVMACAAFLGHRFELGLVEPALYGLALAVGVGRLADRAHWASDQFAGLALGYAAGRTVAIRQLRRKAKREAERLRTPAATTGALRDGFYVSPGTDHVIVGWSRTF